MLNQETREFIRQHLTDDVRKLALKRNPNPAIDLTSALQQIEGWQAARKKLPEWAEYGDILFPPKLSMEQCSSESTAKYKQKLVRRLTGEQIGLEPTDNWAIHPKTHDTRMADLTGGFGIDFSYLAPLFHTAYYVEQQEHLCRIAEHNFHVLGLNQARICHGNATDFLQKLPDLNFVFIDPARRNERGQKTYAISDCEPNLALLQDQILEKAGLCIAKLSPMLDISQGIHTLKNVREIHVVCLENECKELLFVQTSTCPTEDALPQCVCANLHKDRAELFSFTFSEEKKASCRYCDHLKDFLYEPNAALMKAGAFRCVSERFDLEKLHPNTHLYTSDKFIEDFPGRKFRIEAFSSFSRKELKGILQQHQQANLAVRNFPETVATLRKKLKLKDGGDCYLFATTIKDERKILIRCRQIQSFPQCP